MGSTEKYSAPDHKNDGYPAHPHTAIVVYPQVPSLISRALRVFTSPSLKQLFEVDTAITPLYYIGRSSN